MQTDEEIRHELLEVWADLTAFQRDVLSTLSDADDAPHGLQIKSELESYYGEEVLHGRLYPVLDELAEKGMVVKSKRDGRTNEYDLTSRGVAVLSAGADRLDDVRSTPRHTSIGAIQQSKLYE